MQFPDDPDAACQGRQARSLGSDVTASSGTATSTSTCSENFIKNSFKFDVALKHAQDEVPARKSTPEKAEIAARDEQAPETTKKTSPTYTEHGIVSISRRYPLLQ